ncbi:MAG: hypothetical protein ACYSU7_03235 [Planctomycetota bacterium]
MSIKPRTGPDPTSTLHQSETERAVRRIVPWVVSVGIHGGLIGLGFLLTWTVVSLTDEEPVLVVAQFDALTYDPLVTLETDPTPLQEQPLAAPQLSESFQRALAESMSDLDDPSLSLALDPGAAASSRIEFAPAPGENSATFVGMTTSNARRIVYVIDASGSMIRSLQIVIEELARSLGTLSAWRGRLRQRSCARSNGSTSTSSPPGGRTRWPPSRRRSVSSPTSSSCSARTSPAPGSSRSTRRTCWTCSTSSTPSWANPGAGARRSTACSSWIPIPSIPSAGSPSGTAGPTGTGSSAARSWG